MEEKKLHQLIQDGRQFMHMRSDTEDFQSDQQLKKPQPPLFKQPTGQPVLSLPTDFSTLPIDNHFLHVINSRQSHRVFAQQPMNLTQLSYLLWCTQGVKTIRGKAYATLRTVPSGGARHEFECYLAIQNLTGLPDGLYHYLPQSHGLEFLHAQPEMKAFIGRSLGNQVWAAKANVIFYYSCVCYRAEWRYSIAAHRVALIDAGYASENLYLAATSIGLGSCAVAYLDEAECDQAFGLDGQEEFIFLAHPVGTIQPDDQAAEDDFYAFVREQNL